MVLQPILAGFLAENPHVHLELTNDEGFVDIVERGFDAGVRIGESVQKDMIAVRLGGPVTVADVASPAYLQRCPAPKHPDDLARHNCVRFRFARTGAIYKWEFQVGDRLIDYVIGGNITLSDTTFSVDAALEGIGLVYTFEPLVRQHLKDKRLKRSSPASHRPSRASTCTTRAAGTSQRSCGPWSTRKASQLTMSPPGRTQPS